MSRIPVAKRSPNVAARSALRWVLPVGIVLLTVELVALSQVLIVRQASRGAQQVAEPVATVEPRPTPMLTFATQLEAARSQMAFTLGFHIILASVGVAFPALMLIANHRGLRKDDADALVLAPRPRYRPRHCQRRRSPRPTLPTPC